MDQKGLENLANAVVLLAVEDFREARKKLKRRPRDMDAMREYGQAEAFLLSEWCHFLSGIDMGPVVERLRRE